MKKKIKNLIAKIKLWWFHNQCYNKMEGKGIATMSMCCGVEYNDMRLPLYAKECTTCPYFTPIYRSLKKE